MTKLLKPTRVAVAVLCGLALTSCVRFDTRMQANGDFDYEDATLTEPYKTGDFTTDEARNVYDIPTLTEKQAEEGALAKHVDIRPPQQLIPVVEGVLLDTEDPTKTKIWFNAFETKEDVQQKVLTLLEAYLAEKNPEKEFKTTNKSIENELKLENSTLNIPPEHDKVDAKTVNNTKKIVADESDVSESSKHDDVINKANKAVKKADASANVTQIETGLLSETSTFGSYFNTNDVTREAEYVVTLGKSPDGRSVSLSVDAKSYTEINNGDPLEIKLTGHRKKNVEIAFINDLLEFAYKIKEKQQLESLNHQPLPIKLGFDDNNQSVWVVDSPFVDVWQKLPTLLKLLHFKIVEVDKNLGYLLVAFERPSDSYWKENNLNPYELEEAEYFIQLGELSGGLTSITWLDEDKNLLESSKVSKIYLSITDRVREVLLIQDKQKQEF